MKEEESGQTQGEILQFTLTDIRFWAISVSSHTHSLLWYQSYPSEFLENDVLWKTLEAEPHARKFTCFQISD